MNERLKKQGKQGVRDVDSIKLYKRKRDFGEETPLADDYDVVAAKAVQLDVPSPK